MAKKGARKGAKKKAVRRKTAAAPGVWTGPCYLLRRAVADALGLAQGNRIVSIALARRGR